MYARYASFRDQKGFKDADVAKLTGIAPSTFTDWKHGRSKPKIEKCLKIAEVLEISLEDLISNE